LFHFTNCFQCENIVEDQEETILDLFSKEGTNLDVEFCSKKAKVCDEVVLQEDYEFEKEEL